MTYATINADGTISGNTTASAEISPASTTAQGAVSKHVTATASVSNTAINSNASVENNLISATGKLVTEVAIGDIETYTGDYEVTSFCAAPTLTTSLVLQTRQKRMTDNVTVYSVPTTESYNAAGGVTFEIGG